MSRDLFIDTDSRQFIEGMNNSAVKMHGPFFKGDTETINLYFLQRTGLIGTPYTFTDKSSSTTKLSWGTPGASSVLSVTGFTALPTSVTISVTRAQTFTTERSEIQKVSFSSIPNGGFYTLTTSTIGATATLSNGYDGENKQEVFNSTALINYNQRVYFTGITGANTNLEYNKSYNVNGGSRVGYGSTFALNDGATNIPKSAYYPYNGIVSWVTTAGITATLNVEFDAYGFRPSRAYSTTTPPITPKLADKVRFSNLVGVSGITAGVDYWVRNINPDDGSESDWETPEARWKGTQLSASQVKISTLASLKLTQPNIALIRKVIDAPVLLARLQAYDGTNLYGREIAITKLVGNRVRLNRYNPATSNIEEPIAYATNAWSEIGGKFQFVEILDLTGVTIGQTYHINETRNSVNSFFGIFAGEANGVGSEDTTSQITLSTSQTPVFGDWLAVSKVIDGKVQISNFNSVTGEVTELNETPGYDSGTAGTYLGFQFVTLNDLTGVTIGNYYHFNEQRDNNGIGYAQKTFNVYQGLKSKDPWFPDTSSAITGISSGNSLIPYGDSYNITGLNNNMVRFGLGGAPGLDVRNGQFQFVSLDNLSGVTIGTNYHFNYVKSGGATSASDYAYVSKPRTRFQKIYSGLCTTPLLENDTASQITGITSSGPNDYATWLTGMTVAQAVYSFVTLPETTESISWNSTADTVKAAIEKLPCIGTSNFFTGALASNAMVTKTQSGDLLISFLGTRAFQEVPLLTGQSNLISPPGLTAPVGITSAAITTLLSGTTSAPVTLEVELTTSGNKLTAAQGDVTLAVALSH